VRVLQKWSSKLITLQSKRPGQTKTFYRPDLHNELKRLALQRSEGHKTPTVLVGSRVVAVDIENAAVTLADGTVLTGDLIIGADGERVFPLASQILIQILFLN
jgi:salicylate hydroxylase